MDFLSLSELNDRSVLAAFGGTVTLNHYGIPGRTLLGFVEMENPLVVQPLDGREHIMANVLVCMKDDLADVDPEWTVTFEGVEYPVLEVPPGKGLVRVLLGDPIC